MNTLPKTHIEFCNMLYNCIDLTDYPEGSKLYDIIRTEKPRGAFTIELVDDWLRGLPSSCTIPFTDYEIRTILESCGNGHWTIDEYWRFAASRIREFAINPKCYE